MPWVSMQWKVYGGSGGVRLRSDLTSTGDVTNYTVTLSPRTSENQQWSWNEVETTDDLFLLMILICHINYVELWVSWWQLPYTCIILCPLPPFRYCLLRFVLFFSHILQKSVRLSWWFCFVTLNFHIWGEGYDSCLSEVTGFAIDCDDLYLAPFIF